MRRYLFTALILTLISCAMQGPKKVGIRFVMPENNLFTNHDVRIQLEVTGSQEDLELFINNTYAHRLIYPYQFTWDISSYPDGLYTLRAKNKLAQSDSLKVRLDRKAPEIKLLQPLAKVNDFDLSGSIVIEFDEAINAQNLSSHVQVSDEQHILSTSLTYTNHQLRIKLTESPALPTTLTLSINGLSDLAGNQISTSWSWLVPLWHTSQALNINPRQNAIDPVIIVDSAKQPVVAWEEAGNIYVKRWSDQEWQLLGGPLNQAPGHGPSLTSSGNNLYVAWAEGETQADIFVKVWNGKNWKNLGGAVDHVLSHDAARPSLVIDSRDMPVIAFFEYDGQSSNIYVKRWNGKDWKVLGDVLDMVQSQNAAFPSIAMSGQQPVVSWFERQGEKSFIYVKKWNGQTWESLGEALNQTSSKAYHPRIAADAAGNIYVSWFELSKNYKIYVKRWRIDTWENMGDVLNMNPAQDAAYPVIAWRNGELALSWFEMSATQDEVFLKRWQNNTWQIIPTSSVSSTAFATYPSLTLTQGGHPVLAWIESDYKGQQSQIYAQRYNALPSFNLPHPITSSTN